MTIPKEYMEMLKSNDPSTFKLGFLLCKQESLLGDLNYFIDTEGAPFRSDNYWAIKQYFHRYNYVFDKDFSLKEFYD